MMARIISLDRFLSAVVGLDKSEPKNPFIVIDDVVKHLEQEDPGWHYTGDWEWLNEDQTKIVVRFER
jgi:hypothetical protein